MNNNILIKNISNIIYKHINEMAKTVNRTIDKKLWLTVSSTCSRNKSTEAEFIKPVGNDKNNLLLRYVAALLIMKKPCPETESDIDNIKTFKLFGKKLIELGCSFDDIKNLYILNGGKVDNTSNNPNNPNNSNNLNNMNNSDNSDNSDNLNNLNNSDDTDNSNDTDRSLFDFDFLDDNDDLITNITASKNDKLKNAKLSLHAHIETVLLYELNMKKPRGFKFERETTTQYLLFYKMDTSWPGKYVEDLFKLCKEKNWYGYKFHRYVKDKRIEEVYELPDGFIKNFCKENDYNIIRILVSPDNGLMLYGIDTKPNKKTSFYSSEIRYVLTFTGLYNYNEYFLDKDKSENKQIANKILQETLYKRGFLKFLELYRLKGWRNAIKIDDLNLPYITNYPDYLHGNSMRWLYRKFIRNASDIFLKKEPDINNCIYKLLSKDEVLDIYFMKYDDNSTDKYYYRFQLTPLIGKEKFLNFMTTYGKRKTN